MDQIPNQAMAVIQKTFYCIKKIRNKNKTKSLSRDRKLKLAVNVCTYNYESKKECGNRMIRLLSMLKGRSMTSEEYE